MSGEKTNFLDRFLPNLPVMVRFWLIGLIMALVGGIAVWISGAPEAVVSNSNYITGAGGFIGLWLFYVVAMLIMYSVGRSENFDVKGTDGAGSTKYKTGVIWAGLLTVALTIFTVVYTVLSIKHLH